MECNSPPFLWTSNAPPLLQLPIHKAVVVSLKDSDDSDSDVDTCSAAPMGFGGLEFMIKEARRTAEVSPGRMENTRSS